jgi:hypothetical protein
MPAKPKAKPRSARVGIEAKRKAVAKAYGRPPDLDMEGYYYSRRHLAKLPRPDKQGWRELKYIDEECDLDDAIGKTLRRIAARDGTKYFNESANALLMSVAVSIHVRAGSQALRRAIDKLEDYAKWAKDNPRA